MMAEMGTLQRAFRRDRVYDFLIPKVVEDLDLTHGTILYLEDLSVTFDGFRAINELNLYVDAGELRCIIGPNGAGKTTLMDIVTGNQRRPEAAAAGPANASATPARPGFPSGTVLEFRLLQPFEVRIP